MVSTPFKAGTIDNLSFNAIESPSSPEVNENDLNSLEVHAKPFSHRQLIILLIMSCSW